MIGKLPPEILKDIVLKYNGSNNENVITGPAIGEDSAVIKIKNNKYFLISSDPIVGTTNNIGKFLVEINVNDIAAKGGDPKYIILNLLVPEKKGKSFIKQTMKEIDSYCKKYNISIIGGHTELTKKYDEPIVTATIIGESKGLYSYKNIQKEDIVFLIGNIALEGTYLLYEKHKNKLNKILSKKEQKEVLKYIDHLSVYNYSKKIRDHVKYMHDPTEGGVLGGLSEISDLFKNKGIHLYKNNKLKKTVGKIISFFDIDPLKLISSGSLIAIASKNKKNTIEQILNKHNFDFQILGDIRSKSNFKSSFEEQLWDYI